MGGGTKRSILRGYAHDGVLGRTAAPSTSTVWTLYMALRHSVVGHSFGRSHVDRWRGVCAIHSISLRLRITPHPCLAACIARPLRSPSLRIVGTRAADQCDPASP